MKGKVILASVLSLLLVFSFAPFGFATDFQYNVNKEHLGQNATPPQAYEMLLKDPAHTFIVDVRTQPEYQFIGHPVGAYNIPVKFLSNRCTEKGYPEVDNAEFEQDLLTRFNPKTDRLLLLCRSGSRSCVAANLAVKAGFSEDKVFNVMGGFEGDKIKNKNSAYDGQRKLGGWRNEGLPWTYAMEPKLVYQKDLETGASSQ